LPRMRNRRFVVRRKFARARPWLAHMSPVYWPENLAWSVAICTWINDKSWQNDTCHRWRGWYQYIRPVVSDKVIKSNEPRVWLAWLDDAKKKEPLVIAREGFPSSNSISESNPPRIGRRSFRDIHFLPPSLPLSLSLSLVFLFTPLVDRTA
jgi:hypothetical protein